MNWRSLNAIVTDQNNCAAGLLAASILVTVNVHDVVDVYVKNTEGREIEWGLYEKFNKMLDTKA